MSVRDDARWLDRGEDDGCIERELDPGEDEETEQPQLSAAVEKPASHDPGQTSNVIHANQTDRRVVSCFNRSLSAQWLA